MYDLWFNTPAPIRLACLNTTFERAQGLSVQSKFRYILDKNTLLELVISCWMRHSLVHLHHCEENGFRERSTSVQGYEHPGKDPDISLCGHDRCLHRLYCHLLHWQSWLFYSCRRWVCILRKCIVFYFNTTMYLRYNTLKYDAIMRCCCFEISYLLTYLVSCIVLLR